MNHKAIKRRLFIYGALALLLVVIAIFGEKLAPYDPYLNNILAIDQAPNAKYIFGTDRLGRDLLSRILAGAGSSLGATAVIVVMTCFIGTTVGVCAAYFGGVLDTVIQKVLLIMQSFPRQVLAIAVAGVLGAGINNAILALICVGWIPYARISRSMVLKIVDSGYVKAAKLCGCGSISIIIHHVIPNIRNTVFVVLMTYMSSIMMEISGLSFLGLSAKPPYPEWGVMVNEGRKVLMTAPWQVLFPGLAILLTVIILNRLGDSVRDYIEYEQNHVQ